jgi:[Skp1-protein]-hydroxyproline N-acetylglucosaminyltransferase
MRGKEDRAPTIFVSVPSYRDGEAQHTIACLYEQARWPERVFVGVYHQVKAGEDAAVFRVPAPLPDNVRSLVVDAEEATGPCKARHVIQQRLYRGEDYLLSLDSHMRLVQHWDELMLAEIAKCPNPDRAILTCYPPPYELLASSGESVTWRDAVLSSDPKPPYLVCGGFGPEGMLRFKGRLLAAPRPAPVPCCFWVSGFSFSRATVVREVPYADNLPFLFFGEETLMSARLWTAGFDFFCLGRVVAYHLWERTHRPTFFDAKNAELQRASLQRVKDILSGQIVDAEYGLGRARSIGEYWAFCGVNFAEKTFRVPENAPKESEFFRDPAELVLELLRQRGGAK